MLSAMSVAVQFGHPNSSGRAQLRTVQGFHRTDGWRCGTVSLEVETKRVGTLNPKR